ncbi:MAG TPA: tRNA preQ1(34) S-adenosylmethionine ribosyltransferase-isomerase QueA [Syntrophorhabdaceae bacterium]|mgnify:CR=1 FL=1|nr:tRNA preQ1(34) S-adenosylmethionine ribosyltransferase-isomerase QueA [Syntrophorhabdaceae bacterium]
MNIEEFDYHLPEGYIAQYPEKDRASSRLLVYDRKRDYIEHSLFKDITQYLKEGDILVLNDSKVIPARLIAKKETGGIVDITLIEQMDKKMWKCLVKGIKRNIKKLHVKIKDVEARLERNCSFWTIDFSYNGDTMEFINTHGLMPLPPYIKRKEKNDIDYDMYQTVYAQYAGSVAAPTAGLHFTEDLLNKINKMGVKIVKVTLHIGIGTFLLIKEKNVEEHKMHGEYYKVSPLTFEILKRAKQERKRVIACGTSAVRTIESIFSRKGDFQLEGYTDIFIYPGYRFNIVDALITNFHLPRSTPLMLVAAFTGKENLLKCYREAIEKKYRFYSYGDAMFVV